MIAEFLSKNSPTECKDYESGIFTEICECCRHTFCPVDKLIKYKDKKGFVSHEFIGDKICVHCRKSMIELRLSKEQFIELKKKIAKETDSKF